MGCLMVDWAAAALLQSVGNRAPGREVDRVTDEQALARLAQVKHLVVVMMENRSFDHMLGYLKQEGVPDVNGLNGDEYNLGPDLKPIQVTRFDADGSTVQKPGEALEKRLDPDHSKDGVRVQLGSGYGDFPNGGFVKAFVESRRPEDQIGPELWMVPMGFYGGKDLPTYEFLARNFCVCDAWHSSVPGDTWPNRLFALTGREGEKVRPGLLEDLAGLTGPLKVLAGAPIYDVPAFTRQLEDGQWRWYSHDPATLRAADGRYRRIDDLKRDNFAFFDRKKVSVVTQAAEALIVGRDSFLDDAAKGHLRDVSWIDPNFIDLDVLDPNSNDDHPPTDIRAGQAFVLDIYEALRTSPAWQDTVLVVVYDEHGGFFDHVQPPAVHDDSGYATLGVRVPALVVGPRVANAVSHQTFDHSTLIKTILTRFTADPGRAIAQMPRRVADASHLGHVLHDEPRADLPEPVAARTAIMEWRARARAERRAPGGQQPSPAADGTAQPLILNDFQQEFAKFALAMRAGGLPPGQP
jgi:phospholipase C